jgi:hypothetical protein
VTEPLDRPPVEQGPHAANDAALWMSPERIAAIRRAEAIDAHDWTAADSAPPSSGQTVLERRLALTTAEAMTEEANRRAWADLQRREDAARHHRGVERMLRAEDRARDRRDAEDAERTRR